LEVLVKSYEAGLDPISDVEQVSIVDYPNRQPYYGIYDEDHYNESPCAQSALKIFSKRRGKEAGNGE